MAIFFFVIGLEIKREVVFGELRELRKAALPAAAAFGGMVVPAGIYLYFQHGQPGGSGWGIPMATDSRSSSAYFHDIDAANGKRMGHHPRSVSGGEGRGSCLKKGDNSSCVSKRAGYDSAVFGRLGDVYGASLGRELFEKFHAAPEIRSVLSDRVKRFAWDGTSDETAVLADWNRPEEDAAWTHLQSDVE